MVLKKAINLSKATFLSTAKYGVIKSTLMSYYNDKLNVIYVPKTESSFKKQNTNQLGPFLPHVLWYSNQKKWIKEVYFDVAGMDARLQLGLF